MFTLNLDLCYALELPHCLTSEQAAQQFGPLRACALALLPSLAAACVIRRQWMYHHWYYHRDDVQLVAATLARQCITAPPAHADGYDAVAWRTR